MNLEKIESVLLENTNLKICQICGTPYKPYHSRQKTCGSTECKKAYHILCVKNRTEKIRTENPEEYKARRREYSRVARLKKKNKAKRDMQLQELAERWERQSKFDEKVSEYGLEYGKRSAEKVLKAVPKIDVNGFIKEMKDEQKLRDENEPHKST